MGGGVIRGIYKEGKETRTVILLNSGARNIAIKALRFAMSNSIFLAFNGALVVVFASALYGIPVSFNVLLAAFLATFSVYCLNMVTDSKEDAINRSSGGSNRTLFFLVPSVASLIISLAIGLSIGVFALAILLAPLAIGFLYSVKLSKSIPRLKEVVGVKSLVVAFSWAITGTFLPMATGPVFTIKELMVFIYIFAQILVNTIVFDVLDTKGDAASGIVTVPVALGRRKTRTLLFSINALLGIWLIFCSINGFFVNYLPALAFGVFYESAIIWYFLKKDRPKIRAELSVDGEWLPLVIFMKLI